MVTSAEWSPKYNGYNGFDVWYDGSSFKTCNLSTWTSQKDVNRYILGFTLPAHRCLCPIEVPCPSAQESPHIAVPSRFLLEDQVRSFFRHAFYLSARHTALMTVDLINSWTRGYSVASPQSCCDLVILWRCNVRKKINCTRSGKSSCRLYSCTTSQDGWMPSKVVF
jgi:hypothetical protein